MRDEGHNQAKRTPGSPGEAVHRTAPARGGTLERARAGGQGDVRALGDAIAALPKPETIDGTDANELSWIGIREHRCDRSLKVSGWNAAFVFMVVAKCRNAVRDSRRVPPLRSG